MAQAVSRRCVTTARLGLCWVSGECCSCRTGVLSALKLNRGTKRGDFCGFSNKGCVSSGIEERQANGVLALLFVSP